MKKIINPVINNICSNFTNYLDIFKNKKRKISHFEAFSRTFNGISLWLNLKTITNQKEYIYQRYVKNCIIISIEKYFTSSCNSINYNYDMQFVVEAAFFSQGLLRSWNSIWILLNNKTKNCIIKQLNISKKFKVFQSNWILFTTMIEIFLYKSSNSGNISLIKTNYNTYMKWYKGDGWYGDGNIFHFDYYNSYVIHPFLLEITMYIVNLKLFPVNLLLIIKRFQRYIVSLERMINKDGTYPIIGRSITYRFGVFNPLALAVYYNIIPHDLSKGMINHALTAVLKNFIKYPIFQKNGILSVGFTSEKQNNLGEFYISEGSTYLCVFIFFILGIEENNSFWREKDLITSERIWSMKIVKIDHSIDI